MDEKRSSANLSDDLNELMENGEYQEILFRLRRNVFMEFVTHYPEWTAKEIEEATQKRLTQLFNRTLF